MDITLQQIHDFNICPMMYKFKYIMKIERKDESLEQKAHDAVRKSIMFYYYQILNGRQPTQEQLRQKFGSLFYKDMSVEDILTGSTIEKNLNGISMRSVQTLDEFYKRESTKKFTPIAVDMDTRVQVGEKHYLVSTIDLVREMKYSERSLIEVVRFTTTPKEIGTFYVNHSLPLTAHAYAFRKTFQATENRLIVQHMKSGKEFFSVRKEPEMKRLEAIVNGVCGAIEKEAFYPVHNIQCNSCLYKDVCDKYKF